MHDFEEEETFDFDDKYVLGTLEVCGLDRDWFQIIKFPKVNKTIKFKLDTGAHINVIPNHVFRLLGIREGLIACNMTVKNYDDHKLNVLGKIRLTIECNELFLVLEFVVIDTNTTASPVLGI